MGNYNRRKLHGVVEPSADGRRSTFSSTTSVLVFFSRPPPPLTSPFSTLCERFYFSSSIHCLILLLDCENLPTVSSRPTKTNQTRHETRVIRRYDERDDDDADELFSHERNIRQIGIQICTIGIEQNRQYIRTRNQTKRDLSSQRYTLLPILFVVSSSMFTSPHSQHAILFQSVRYVYI